MPVVRTLLAIAAALIAGLAFIYWYDSAGQQPDRHFIATVSHPAYSAGGPLVLIDAAHRNWHTMSGRYAPLAALLRSDGYTVRVNRRRIDSRFPDSVRVLIIANALGPDGREQDDAFTPAEDTSLANWVARGGSLLLIADHAPFGAAALNLSRMFGVEMFLAYARDDDNSGWDNEKIRFTRAQGLLGEHPILSGRNAAERVDTVVSFTGQSLSVPGGATALLRMSDDSYDWKSRSERESARGHAQAVAFSCGRGRVVVLGEAGMLSAQVDPLGFRMGMNAPGNDDRQFALNIMHWLSRADGM